MNQNPAQDMMSYLQYVGDEWAKGWLQRSGVDRSGVFLPNVYLEMTDNLYDAYALAQIMYWSELSEDFKPRLKHLFKDHLWVVKTYEEWCSELHFPNVRAVRDSFERLKQRGLIIRERHKSPYHDAKVVLFIRMNWTGFGNLLTVVMSGMHKTAEVPLNDTSEVTLQGTSEMTQERTSESHSQVTSLPENTSETTTESTAVKEKDSADAGASDQTPIQDLDTLDPVPSDSLNTATDVSPIKEPVEQSEESDTTPVEAVALPEPANMPAPLQPVSAAPVERKVSYKEAVLYAWQLTPAANGKGVENQYISMLAGKGEKGTKWEKFHLDPPATVSEIVAYGRWFRANNTGINFTVTPEAIHLHFGLFRQSPDYERHIARAVDIIAQYALTGVWATLPGELPRFDEPVSAGTTRPAVVQQKPLPPGDDWVTDESTPVADGVNFIDISDMFDQYAERMPR